MGSIQTFGLLRIGRSHHVTYSILPFKAQIKHGTRTIKRNCPIEGEVTFCVQGVSVAIGDIVTYHAYVQLPEGSNAVTLDVSLPTGMTYVAGSANIALASPGGDITSTAITTTGLQVAENPAAIIPATYEPTAAYPGTVDTGTSGHVKFNLGTVADNDNSTVANYVVVEFNAVVANSGANVKGGTIPAAVTVASLTSSPNATVTIEEPKIAIDKVITSINQSTDLVTYQLTFNNTGNSTAYSVALSDTLPGTDGSVTGSTGGTGQPVSREPA